MPEVLSLAPQWRQHLQAMDAAALSDLAHAVHAEQWERDLRRNETMERAEACGWDAFVNDESAEEFLQTMGV